MRDFYSKIRLVYRKINLVREESERYKDKCI